MVEDKYQNPVSSLLSEFETRLNEVEEKQRITRDRILLIGENLVSTKQEIYEKNFDMIKNINEIKLEIKNLKRLVYRIVNEIPNFARKSELEILENQSKIFQPLELTTKKEVSYMIDEAINKK